MGKRIMGKASFAELKDAEGRIQVYVSRDDISTDEENNVQCGFKNYWILAIFGVRGTVLKRKWEICSCLWIDGFGKALKPLPVVKTDADGKPMMHLPIQNNVTAVVM
jgi:lysyl-tRNA synthetase class 2